MQQFTNIIASQRKRFEKELADRTEAIALFRARVLTLNVPPIVYENSLMGVLDEAEMIYFGWISTACLHKIIWHKSDDLETPLADVADAVAGVEFLRSVMYHDVSDRAMDYFYVQLHAVLSCIELTQKDAALVRRWGSQREQWFLYNASTTHDSEDGQCACEPRDNLFSTNEETSRADLAGRHCVELFRLIGRSEEAKRFMSAKNIGLNVHVASENNHCAHE